jgi:ceramide glucosyltransferase
VTLSVILGVLAALSSGLMLWQLFVAWRFPLHRRVDDEGFAPGITVLKPLKGCDSETPACLRSWFEQQYDGPVQLLFGVASMDDPVCAVVERFITDHPGVPAQLVVCSETLGTNSKISKLAQLERLAQYDVLCISDADVWVPADFLANAVTLLRKGDVGLVNCLYKFVSPSSIAMRWEAFAVNADFWSQVLQSLSLAPMNFGLGAAMVMPRRQIAEIGGFARLVNHLADDYQLGKLICGNGARIELSPVVVECRMPRMTLAEVFSHQLRWARTIRVCRPWAYFATVFSIPILWPALWVILTPAWVSAAGAMCCLGIRALAGIYLEGKMTGQPRGSSAAFAVVKDVLQLGVWALAFTGRQVVWRGVSYRVEHGGKLVRLPEATRAAAPSA